MDVLTSRASNPTESSSRPDGRVSEQGNMLSCDSQHEVKGPGHDDANEVKTVYLQGIRFWMVTFALAVMVFMVTFEIPVVTTALVVISSDLGDFDNLSWVVSSYLLGYVAVIIVFAKISDIFGRKPIFVASILLFLVFSAACSAAQTLTQLIIFRAFQGLGGGGCYSLGTIIVSELVPKAQYATYTARLSIAVSLALLVGPIIGGAIAANTSWRWIFIINVPVASLALVLVIISMPRAFPHQETSSKRPPELKHILSKSTLNRLDIQGAFMLLIAVLTLTAGFEEADSRFPWKSAYVITLLVVSGTVWILLMLWERHITLHDNVREPVLPWRFFTNRVMLGVLLVFFFLGGPFIVSVYQLPQRFQLVNGLSGLDAGVRLMPFTFASPVGTGLAAGIAGKFKVPPIWIIIAGSALQVVGFSLLGTLPDSLDLLPRIYGYEIIAGFGCGMNLALLFVIIPGIVDVRDQGVALGAGSQFRMMGSAIALAIATSVFDGQTRTQLANILGLADSNASLLSLAQYIGRLTADEQDGVRRVLVDGYNWQMIVLAAFAAAQIPAALLMWQTRQIRV
ncbi:major facilitator superfamily domain-containing protein [Xylariomycetidae sp. FL0641]|nr:major facilitator superfamily domain-containing protein [Xylariomycetidae sp. FL0641]